MTNTISACIVAHNEEKVIERCLKSIRDVVQEIILVHDGECNDRTVEIARRYGAKVFFQPFNGEAEKHRPFSYEQTTGDWILQIDADEYLSKKAQRLIPTLLKEKDIDAYAFRWPVYNFKTKKYIKGPFDKQLKTVLLRKSKMYFVAISHEAPLTSGKFVKRPDILLHHKPLYNNFSFTKIRNKWIKWEDLHAREIINYKQVEVYHYDPRYIEPIYTYYANFIKHPYYTAIKRYIIFDTGKKVLRKGLIGSPLINYKILFYSYLSVLYLAKKITYYRDYPL